MHIIPLPMSIENRPGEFVLTPETGIFTDLLNEGNADYLHKMLSSSTGFPIPVIILTPGEGIDQEGIYLRLEPTVKALGSEGYTLEIQPGKVEITAFSTAGVFYGIQTLRQLLPNEIEFPSFTHPNRWQIPCLFIQDKPRFTWRGFMLDESRHFFSKETIFLTLDLMSLQKLNVFHWHLTDDQGWRIEIGKYPKLTSVGSRRAGTSRSLLAKGFDGIPFSGFYTHGDIREIVDYAAKRHIMVVPEVEMPGHALAALASYPELSCTGKPLDVATQFGIHSDIFCAGKETVFTFLEDVLGEVLELFPSPYIHVGGDEVPKYHWRHCPDCQRRIRDHKLRDIRHLQVYFTNRIAAFLGSQGRHLVGWNQILQDGLGAGAIVQFWAGSRKRLLEAIKSGKQPVIMSSYLDTYLDHHYYLLPLSKAYRYEPIPSELDGSCPGSILGVESPLWSEWVPNRERLDYQVYPRLIAMAETGWTEKERKDYPGFLHRLERFLGRLSLMGIHYAPLVEAEPARIRRCCGLFTIALPKKKTAY
jgi:hexosaminidase